MLAADFGDDRPPGRQRDLEAEQGQGVEQRATADLRRPAHTCHGQAGHEEHAAAAKPPSPFAFGGMADDEIREQAADDAAKSSAENDYAGQPTGELFADAAAFFEISRIPL